MLLEEIRLEDLAQSCQEESQQFRKAQQEKQGFCFELFRRAVEYQDQTAWELLFNQYQRLVAIWVNGPRDTVEARVNEAFARFWQAMLTHDFQKRFKGIGKVLAYLRMCAWSVKTDIARREQKEEIVTHLKESDDQVTEDSSKQIIEQVLLEELFDKITNRLKDEDERLIFNASFRDGLMPKQIANKYPDVYPDVKLVHRIKERIVLRLSSDPQLRSWWENA